jgi:hypothetical protein
MRIRSVVPVLVLVLMAAVSAGLRAQSAPQPTPSAQAKASPGTSDARSPSQLRVQVTIARYAGEKKTVSLPFTLWVTTEASRTSLNAGQNVEVPTTRIEDGKSVPGFLSRNIGTQITCAATVTADGRYKLEMQISDSYLAPAKTEGQMVTFKSLSTSNSLLLRDGQTAEFATSTDMVTGEVTRIDVTVTTLK